MRLEMDLSMCTPELHLFHSRKKCRSFLERIGWDPDRFRDADAQTWCGWARDGVYCAVVLMEADSSWHAEAALLAHEAVHVAEAVTRELGIDDEEARAYMCQSASYELFVAHERWKRNHGLG